jgi:hypothetical protein
LLEFVLFVVFWDIRGLFCKILRFFWWIASNCRVLLAKSLIGNIFS